MSQIKSKPTLVQVSGPTNLVYATDFNLTENPISENGRWTSRPVNGFVGVQTANGRAFGKTTGINGYDDSYTYLKSWTGGPNYEITGTVFVDPALPKDVQPAEIELHLRVQETPTSLKLYECLFSATGGFQLMRWDYPGTNPFFTDVNTRTSGAGNYSRSLITGDQLKARIVGSEITCSINDVMIWKGTDGLLTSGYPGFGFFHRPPNLNEQFCLEKISIKSL